MASSTRVSATVFKLLGMPSVTRPAPDRMDEMAVMAAAPVFPVDPETIIRCPLLPL